MSLANLIRKRENKDVATATVAIFAIPESKTGATVAKIAGIAVANPEKQKTAPQADLHAWRWRVRFPGWALTVTYSPEVTREEVLADHPTAIKVEPVPDTAAGVAVDPVPMTPEDEAAIRGWLTSIGEDDPETTTEVLAGCRRDADVLAYFVGRAKEAPQPDPTPDDRRGCWQCSRLRGEHCTAGRVVFLDIPQRCESFAPTPGALYPDNCNERE